MGAVRTIPGDKSIANEGELPLPLSFAEAAFQSLTAATLNYTGDVVCQTVLEGRTEIDQPRALRNALIGVAFTPLIHYWYGFLERTFGQLPPSRLNGILKLMVDQLLFSSFLTVFYFWLSGMLDVSTPVFWSI